MIFLIACYLFLGLKLVALVGIVFLALSVSGTTTNNSKFIEVFFSSKLAKLF